jgi:hypothetical protein
MRYYSHILLNFCNLLLHSAIRIQEPSPNNFRVRIIKKKIRKCWYWEFQRARDTWKKERKKETVDCSLRRQQRQSGRERGSEVRELVLMKQSIDWRRSAVLRLASCFMPCVLRYVVLHPWRLIYSLWIARQRSKLITGSKEGKKQASGRERIPLSIFGNRYVAADVTSPNL